MAAQFTPMGGGQGQSMPQQQQYPQQQQRPPMGGNLAAAILRSSQQQTGPLAGWQTEVTYQERVHLIASLITNLRLTSGIDGNMPRLEDIAMKLEKEVFEKSPSKEQYKAHIDHKMEMLTAKREQNIPQLQESINAQQRQQRMTMNRNGVPAQMARTTSQQQPQNPSQQPFRHLQHQMQASPLPGQQPQAQQIPGQMPMEHVTQNLPRNQQRYQVSMQRATQPQQHNGPGRPMSGQHKVSREDHELVMEEVRKTMNGLPDEQKDQTRASLQKISDPHMLQRYQAITDPYILQVYQPNGPDPVELFFHNQFLSRLMQQRLNRANQAQAQAAQHMGQPHQPQGVSNMLPYMEQELPMNTNSINGQPASSMAVSAEFGSNFIGNMESIIGQQQQAGVMAQEAGQMVVPATQHNATPQTLPMNGQAMNVDQRPPNLNARAQQAQHMFHQQQGMQNVAQRQAQIRAQQQQKAAQMALQGQPGGMGSGPVPPQQSPAMGTLNTPLRNPNRPHTTPDATQISPNGQFVPALEQRFDSGNQRIMGQGGLNPSMFAQMPQETRNMLLSLPPDRMQEFVTKMQERAQVAQGRVPLQQGGPVRPGQLPQTSGHSNPQNAGGHTMGGNQVRPHPFNASAGLNPMQPQRTRMQQDQMHGGQPVIPPTTNLQFLAQHMEDLPIPHIIRVHQRFPRGVPVEAATWSQVKRWASKNKVESAVVDDLKVLQRTHASWILKAQGQQQGQFLGAQHLPQDMQNGMAPMGVIAPVAQMGPNSKQVSGGPNKAGGPTPQLLDMNKLRNHPSGQFVTWSDDMLRDFIRNNTATRIRQQQNINGHGPQTNLPPHPQSIPLNQQPPNIPTGVGQLHVPPSLPNEPALKQTTDKVVPRPTINRPQNPRPPTARAVQQSSPAPIIQTRKRASSDDVMEVSPPNVPQWPNSKQSPQQFKTGQFTPQQLASVPTEARKQYEAAIVNQENNVVDREKVVAERLKDIAKEEQQRADQPRRTVHMDVEMKKTMMNRLMSTIIGLQKVGKVLHKWYLIVNDDASADMRAREYFRVRALLTKQFRNLSARQFKDSFTITLTEVEQANYTMSMIIGDLSKRYPEMKKGESSQVHATPPPMQDHIPDTGTLTAANLQEQQQQLSKINQRSGSRSTQTPAAPTSRQPPFPFGPTSPQGTPNYVGKPSVSVENLHIPARKKQKPNSAGGQGHTTPNHSFSSPQSTRKVPNELSKARVSEPRILAKPMLLCPDKDCERHVNGFENEDDLRHHTQEDHIQPLEDPLKYASDNLSTLLGLDRNGQSKRKKSGDNENADTINTGIKIAETISNQGQTPKVKAGNTLGAVYMGQRTSMQRQGSSTAASSGQTKADGPVDPSKGPAGSKTGNLVPTEIAHGMPQSDAWGATSIDPNELMQNFKHLETGACGAIADMNVYRSLTPNDTPDSSKDGVSEPNSDISDGVALDISLDIFDEQWMPFGAPFSDNFADVSTLASTGDFPTHENNKVSPLAWDDVIVPGAFDKPFVMDTSLFSMDVA